MLNKYQTDNKCSDCLMAVANTLKRKLTETYKIFKNGVKKVAEMMGVNGILVAINFVADRYVFVKVSLKLFGTAIIPALAVAVTLWAFVRFQHNPLQVFLRWTAKEFDIRIPAEEGE